MTILDQLAEYSRTRVAADLKIRGREEMISLALGTSPVLPEFAFEKALKKPGISFICECKKASPSKGLIAPVFPYKDIAAGYEAAGADCISVLTEPKWFLGSDKYLEEIAKSVKIPCLRKDFTVDEYQIYQAKTLGASAVLLICSILTPAQLREYIGVADSLGLSALVEAHDDAEVSMAIDAGARIIGVNNRNLKDFSVDTGNSARLRELIPADIAFVSESGVKNAEDVKRLYDIGADAVLIGETLMRAEDKRAKLAELKSLLPRRTGIKLCGLTRPEDIACANRLKPDYVGFVFAKKSKRYVSPERAAGLKKQLDYRIKAAGVFVDEAPEKVAELLNDGIIDIAQLHGSEDASYIAALRSMTNKPVIDAYKIKSPADLEKAEKSTADYLLLDSGAGTGETFDWSILEGFERPYFLAGGLSPENAGRAVRTLHPYAVDVSSGIETNGLKDQKKMAEFVSAVRKEDER